jgi:hypothetical protein
MKTARTSARLAIFMALMLVGFVAPAKAESDLPLSPIFNGRDLSGWQNAESNPFWRADDGVLVGESDGKLSENYLLTEKPYGDFVLEFEVRWTGEVDTGIDFRKPRIQLQLGVSRSLKRDMSGSFYVGKPGYPEAGRVNDAAKLMHPEGQWNRFRLEATGPKFTVWINGQRAVEYLNENFPGAAPIGLQIHGGLKMKVEYRNLRASAKEVSAGPMALVAHSRSRRNREGP